MQETETRNKKINALPEFFAVLALIGIHVAVIYRYGFSVPEQLEFYKWAEVNGDFAMPVQCALLSDGEKILGKLPPFTMSSNLFDMFGKDFIGVGCDNPIYNDKQILFRVKKGNIL